MLNFQQKSKTDSPEDNKLRRFSSRVLTRHRLEIYVYVQQATLSYFVVLFPRCATGVCFWVRTLSKKRHENEEKEKKARRSPSDST